MIKKEITIMLENGLHARPSAELVKGLKAFSSSVEIIDGTKHYNAKSILNMMTSSIREGAIVNIIVDGPDEETTMEWLASFLQRE
ncbi:MAG: HPr family phosphocarrier protein [Bacillota bacterium]|nr:HPr family phosphocarrier protein [Bacillota bacterium]